MNIKIQQDILDSNVEKIVFCDNESFMKYSFLDNDFLLVLAKEDEENDEIVFSVKNGSERYRTNSRQLPSNIVLGVNLTDNIRNLLDAVNIEIDESVEPRDIWKNLYSVNKKIGFSKSMKLEHELSEVRSLLENTKHTLKNLSMFVYKNNPVLSKIDLNWPPFPKEQSKYKILKLYKNKIYRQRLPISSLSVAGLKLFFPEEMLRSDYTFDETMEVVLNSVESGRLIAKWRVPLYHLESELILETSTPFVAEKREALEVCISVESEHSVPVLLSKSVLDKRYYLEEIGKDEVLRHNSPLAVEVYKCYETFSLNHSPYIEDENKVLGEFDKYFLSPRVLHRVREVVTDFTNEEREELSVDPANGSIEALFRDLSLLEIEKAIGKGVESIAVSATVDSSDEVEMGILIKPHSAEEDFQLYELLYDPDYSERMEREGFFSGWYTGKKNVETYINIFSLEPLTEIHDLLLVARSKNDRRDHRVRWTSAEVSLFENRARD